MDKELPIQQVAARTGLSIHTLRYYERLGLMATPAILPLIAASTGKQLDENLEALNVHLTQEHLTFLNTAG